MDDNTRVAKEKTFWDKLSPEYMYNKNSVGSNALTDRVQVHSGKLKENLEKVRRMGVEDAKFVSFKEAGVNLSRLANIWEMGYLSGRKVKSFGRGEKR